MLVKPSFRKSLGLAISLHLAVFFLLLFESEPKTATPQLSPNTQEALELQEKNRPSEKPVINAVSLNNEEVMQAVSHLKQEKENQLRMEAARQKALQEQAAIARKQRILEQQRIARIKKEEEALALKRKKQIEEEKRHLKQLALERAQESNRLQKLKTEQESLKKKQQEETEKLVEMQRKQTEDRNLEEQKKAAELAEKNRIAAQKASRLSGEIDKYKGLIIGAISRQWILPDNANNNLSSKFRIHLAPDGAVLDVKLIRSSGDSILDRSAQTAILKASPLPVPSNPEVFELFRDISLTVRPENVRG